MGLYLFYFTHDVFTVVNIRFFPFMQLGLCWPPGRGSATSCTGAPGTEVWPELVGALAVLPFSCKAGQLVHVG